MNPYHVSAATALHAVDYDAKLCINYELLLNRTWSNDVPQPAYVGKRILGHCTEGKASADLELIHSDGATAIFVNVLKQLT